MPGQDGRVVIDVDFEKEAREYLDRFEWDYGETINALVSHYDKGVLTYDEVSGINRVIDELVALGRNPVTLRVGQPYDKCDRYFGVHRYLGQWVESSTGTQGCRVQVHEEWAQWTIERLASGLIHARREED
jgi:hypothetical protein